MSPVLFALWWAVLAWAGEQSILMYERFIRHRPETWVLEYAWLGLIAYALTFGIAGTILRGFARTPRRQHAIEGALAGLAGFCFLLVFGSLAAAAAVLLAMGLGVRVATLSERTRSLLHGLIRRTLPALGVAAGAALIGTAIWYPMQEQAALRKLPPAPPNAPNVILL